MARNLKPQFLNEVRNLLAAFTQFFLQWPEETIRPPKDNRAMLRQALAASKDKQFTQWAAEYIGNPKHQGIPIAHRELAISLLDYCGITVGEKTLNSAFNRIRKNLEDYIKVSPYVMNPPITIPEGKTAEKKGYYQCAAWQHRLDKNKTILTDENGNRLPRVKEPPYPRVFYFYRQGHVPHHGYDKEHYLEHLGDPDYVQPAPEKDPDSEV